MNFTRVAVGMAAVTVALMAPTTIFAHVAVLPNTVGVGSSQTFDIGVPSELDQPTVGLRLVLPSGLEEVTPNVKPGWTIDIKKSGTGDAAKVTEIDWTAGSVPAGQRDDFLFRAQVPSSVTTLNWKAYQTYQDGTIVSWDATPGTAEKEGVQGPYSQTKVVDDLQSSSSAATGGLEATNAYIAPIALVLSILALYLALRKP